MDKKVYRILANLAKDSDVRNEETMQELADMLTAEGNNELKDLFNQWLEEHPDAADTVPEDDDTGEDTMVLNDHDADLLKQLMK